MKVVQIIVTLNVSAPEYGSQADSVASMLAGVRGLSETMFFLNPDAGVVAGVCVFQDELARDDFLAGPVLLRIREAPFQRRLEIRLFDLMASGGWAAQAAGETLHNA